MSTHRECILRVTRDIRDVQSSNDLSIAVAFHDEDVKKCRALILGPAETPYEFGFFEFSVKFPNTYPTHAPEVKAVTTNSGRTRFNPNIYSEGKVCLSILGTWRGEKGEEWSSAQGLSSILWSIQSLMSPNPYENEPGFEGSRGEKDKKEPMQYKAKVYHETLRISVLQRLEGHFEMREAGFGNDSNRDASFGTDDALEGPWEPFIELCKRRFLWYYDCYLDGIEEAQKIHGKTVLDGQQFIKTPFEAPGNQMAGTFEYTKLQRRLKDMLKRLQRETETIAQEGKQAAEKENPTALLYQNTFRSLKRKFEGDCDTAMDMELAPGNPFDWQITLFGRPMTNLEGGIFRIRMIVPIDFPDRQPRVIVETPLFHHRISSNKTLCYIAIDQNQIASHLEGIIKAIEDEDPRYDPRECVNPEASKLLWGTPDQKKQYTRQLRRSAQRSSEE